MRWAGEEPPVATPTAFISPLTYETNRRFPLPFPRTMAHIGNKLEAVPQPFEAASCTPRLRDDGRLSLASILRELLQHTPSASCVAEHPKLQ